MMASSQAAVNTPITLLSTSWTWMASGTSSSAITLLVMPRTVSQICGLASSRKPNTYITQDAGQIISENRADILIRRNLP